jgi:hypothetical protein
VVILALSIWIHAQFEKSESLGDSISAYKLGNMHEKRSDELANIKAVARPLAKF